MIEASLAVLVALAQAPAAAAAPPDAEDLPAHAVDHVVTMLARDCLLCVDHRRTMIRSGPWVREEISSYYPQSRYSHLASGTSFRLFRDSDGRVDGFSVERASPARERPVLRRARAGSRATWLGEPCEVWLITGRHDYQDSCETADGVQLWTRQLGRDSWATGSFTRAISVERRPVRPEEARPPADFFSRAPALSPVPAGEAGAFEVRFLFGRGDGPVEELYRRSGRVSVYRAVAEDGRVSLWGDDGVVRFTYEIDADGRPQRLHVRPVSDDAHAWRADEGWVPVPGRRRGSLFGERCTWQQQWRADATSDPYQCRTPDGVPLMFETRPERGEPVVHRASSLRRGGLDPADFVIPAAATDWATWGVEPPP